MANREIASYEQILLLQKCFQGSSAAEESKSVYIHYLFPLSKFIYCLFQLSKFLQKQEKTGIIKLSQISKGVDGITEMDRSHEMYV